MSFTIIGPNAHEVDADRIDIVRPVGNLSVGEFEALSQKILVAILHRPDEGIHASLSSNTGLWSKMNTAVAHISDQFGGMIEMTRSGVARTFLSYVQSRPNIEYIVMMDNDQSVPWQAPYLLCQWGKPIVSGVVCSFSLKKGGVFACFTLKDKYGISRFPSVKNTKRMPAKGLVEVDHAGTGLIAVHRDVFRAILQSGEFPFMIPEDVRRHCAATGNLRLGEDMAFCEQAIRQGFKVYVDLSVRAPHFKTLAVSWPDELISSEIDCRDWSVSDIDYTTEQ